MTFYSFPLNGSPASNGIRREMDRIVNEVFGAPRASGNDSDSWTPATDVVEENSAFVVTLDLPGVPSNQVEVLAEDGVLTVRGTKPGSTTSEGTRAMFRERRTGRFERKFRLPKSADASAIQASYADGVLTIEIAKVAPVQPRRVEVKVDRGPVAEQLQS